MIRLITLLVLTSCTTPVVVMVPRQQAIPAALRSCSGPIAPPPALPRLRTVEELKDWAMQTEHARQRSESARADCAAKLARLRRWVEQRKWQPEIAQ